MEKTKKIYYQLITITKPDAGEKMDAIARDILNKCGALLVKFETLGVKKLAYPVKNHEHGAYNLYELRINATTEKETINTIEKELRAYDDILKMLLVQTEAITMKK